MAEKKPAKRKKPRPKKTAPRRLLLVELEFLYEALHKVLPQGSKNTRVKADLLAWIEGQVPKQGGAVGDGGN